MNKKFITKILTVSGLALAAIGVGQGLTTTTADAATQVGRVVYKPGYGINLWNLNNNKLTFSGRRLKHGTSWKILGSKSINGHLFYNLGGNQYFDSSYIKIEKPDQIGPFAKEKGRVGEVSYMPGYGINLWNVKNNKLTFSGRRLPHGSRWKITGTISVNGRIFYALGTNQYFDSQYINVRNANGQLASDQMSVYKPFAEYISSGNPITTSEEILPYNRYYTPNINKIRTYFLKYVNELRAVNGMEPLQHSSALDSIAQNHVDDPVNGPGQMVHVGRDNVFENLYGGGILANSDQESAYRLVEGWFNEINNVSTTSRYGHRANLIFTKGNMGLAVNKYGLVGFVVDGQGMSSEDYSKHSRVYNAPAGNENFSKFMDYISFRYIG